MVPGDGETGVGDGAVALTREVAGSTSLSLEETEQKPQDVVEEKSRKVVQDADAV